MGTQLHPSRGTAPSPNFGPCLLWPNGRMDQDATCYKGRPRPRPHCVTWGPRSPSQKGHSPSPSLPPPQFSAHVYCGQAFAHLRIQHTVALCMLHSPTAAALSTSFLLNHSFQKPKLNALITRFSESYRSVSVSCESKILKNSSSNWLNSGNALNTAREKCHFCVSRFAR